MAENKVKALLMVSEVNLERAGKRLDIGEYDSAVSHASLAVESAANAMILNLGGSEARDHRAVSGLAAVLRRVRPELLREEKHVQLIEKGRRIEREVVYARYPLKVAGRWVTPMEYYTREKAKLVIEDAKFVVSVIEESIKRTAT